MFATGGVGRCSDVRNLADAGRDGNEVPGMDWLVERVGQRVVLGDSAATVGLSTVFASGEASDTD